MRRDLQAGCTNGSDGGELAKPCVDARDSSFAAVVTLEQQVVEAVQGQGGVLATPSSVAAMVVAVASKGWHSVDDAERRERS